MASIFSGAIDLEPIKEEQPLQKKSMFSDNIDLQMPQESTPQPQPATKSKFADFMDIEVEQPRQPAKPSVKAGRASQVGMIASGLSQKEPAQTQPEQPTGAIESSGSAPQAPAPFWQVAEGEMAPTTVYQNPFAKWRRDAMPMGVDPAKYQEYVNNVRTSLQNAKKGTKEYDALSRRWNAIITGKESERLAGQEAGSAQATLEATQPIQNQAQKTLAGLTFGLSEIPFEKFKESKDIQYMPQSTYEQTLNALGQLGGAILTGRYAGTKLPAPSSMKMAMLQTVGLAGMQGVGNAVSDVALGRQTIPQAAGNIAQTIVSSMAGRWVGLKVPPGVLNFVAQVGTDFLTDMFIDGAIRDKITGPNGMGWKAWLISEIPSMMASVVGAGEDYATARRTMANRVDKVKDIMQAPEPPKKAVDWIGKEAQEEAKKIESRIEDKSFWDVKKEAESLGIQISKNASKQDIIQKINTTKEDKAYTEATPNPRRAEYGSEFDPEKRRFPQRVAQIYPETKEGISSLDLQIDHLSNKSAIDQARQRIATDELGVLRDIKDNKKAADPIVFTAAQLMIDDAIRAGNVDKAIAITDDFSPNITPVAQALQKLTLMSRLTPGGMLRKIESDINRAVTKKAGKAPEDTIKNKALAESLNLTQDEKRRIVGFMTEAQKAKARGDGRAHDLNVARALAIGADKIPAGFWKKVSMVQTLAQLLNVKTIGRNIIGNTAFAGLDNVSKSFASFVDYLASKATGKRTTSLPSVREQLKGYKRGWTQAVEEIGYGVDVKDIGTKFDLPHGKVFTSRIGQLAEKMLSYALRAPDRAAYEAEFFDSVRRQMKAANTKTATPEMIENAMYDGLYVTFQDSSVAAKFFTGLKKLLNFGKDFGIGDLVLKYPKTPANLLQRGIDYSPIGALRGVMEFAAPIFGKQLNQYRASLDLSRGVTGTGMFLAAMMLAKLGIVTGAGEKDKDVEALERAQGRGQYRVNTSSLKRFVLSGFNPDVAKAQDGDVYATYDWAQPMALTVGGGATLGESTAKQQNKAGDMLGMVASTLEESTKTLTEQPLLTGVRRIAQGENVVDSLMQTLASAPSSFIPTIMGQMALYSDPTIKDAKDRKLFLSAVKQAAKKIPILNQYLPNRIASTGEKIDIKNPTLFNIFVNPAIITENENRPGANLVVDLYRRGFGQQTRQFPRLVSDTLEINGKKLVLTPAEKNRLQEITGKEVMKRLDELAKNPNVWTASPEKVALTIDTTILTPVSNMAKQQLIKELGGIQAVLTRTRNTQ